MRAWTERSGIAIAVVVNDIDWLRLRLLKKSRLRVGRLLGIWMWGRLLLLLLIDPKIQSRCNRRSAHQCSRDGQSIGATPLLTQIRCGINWDERVRATTVGYRTMSGRTNWTNTTVIRVASLVLRVRV